MLTTHLSPEQIDALVTEGHADAALHAHLSQCQSCRTAVESQERMHRLLRPPVIAYLDDSGMGSAAFAAQSSSMDLDIEDSRVDVSMDLDIEAFRLDLAGDADFDDAFFMERQQQLRKRPDRQDPESRALRLHRQHDPGASGMPHWLGRVLMSVLRGELAVLESGQKRRVPAAAASRPTMRRDAALREPEYPKAARQFAMASEPPMGRSKLDTRIELHDEDVRCRLRLGPKGGLGIDLADRWTRSGIDCAVRFIDQHGDCQEGIPDGRGSVVIESCMQPGRLDVATDFRTWNIDIIVD